MKTFVIANFPEAQALLDRTHAAVLKKWSKNCVLYQMADAHILITGVGKNAVKKCLNHYLTQFTTNELINVGTAGLLANGDQKLGVISPTLIIDDPAGYFWKQSDKHGFEAGKILVTVNEPVLKTSEKTILQEKYHADIVDMEASKVVYCAIKYSLHWQIVKVVTDWANEMAVSDYRASLVKAAQSIADISLSL